MSAVDVRAVGLAVVALGGGRTREDDPVDHSVGLTDVAAPGEEVAPGGRPLAMVHAKDEESARRATEALREAYTLGDRAARTAEVVLGVDAGDPEGRAPRPPRGHRSAGARSAASPSATGSSCRTGCSPPRPLRLPRLPRLPRHLRQGRQRHPHRRGLPRHHLRVPREVRGRGRDLRRAHRLAGPRAAGRPHRRGAHRRHRARDRRRPRRDRHRGPHPDLVRAQLRRGAGAARSPATPPSARTPTSWASRWRATRRTTRPATTRRRSRSPPTPASAAPSTPASGPARRACAAALELPVTRIAHGVRSIEDPALVEELAERGTYLECCPTSNVVLGHLPELRGAPAAPPARRRSEGHARLRRPAVLRRLDRRRVRDLPPALRLRRTTS